MAKRNSWLPLHVDSAGSLKDHSREQEVPTDEAGVILAMLLMLSVGFAGAILAYIAFCEGARNGEVVVVVVVVVVQNLMNTQRWNHEN